EIHSQLAPLTEFYMAKLPHYLDFVMQMYEADGTVVRQAVNDAAKQADHSEIMERFEALAEKGQAKRLGTMHLPTRSGQRASIGRGAEGPHATSLSVDAQKRVSMDAESRPVESQVEIDPVLGPDGRTVDLNMGFKHHFAPSTERWEPLVPGG